MEEYNLEIAEIEDQYRNIKIYPNTQVVGVYLIHWYGFEIGAIEKRDGKWFTNAVELITVVNETRAYLEDEKV